MEWMKDEVVVWWWKVDVKVGVVKEVYCSEKG